MSGPQAHCSAGPVRVLPTRASAPAIDVESLSTTLKARTADSHRRVEQLLGLPGAIRDRQDYERWLGRFFGFYQPLESALAEVAEPDGHGIETTRHSHRLADDLRTLEVEIFGLGRALPAELPGISTFAHGVGARYVLMGATLGGRCILRDLDARLGTGLGAATAFLRAGGPDAISSWPACRSAIDRFGIRYPQSRGDVIAGAIGTFDALHAWFVPFCDAQSQPG